jgi:hypothetical protein
MARDSCRYLYALWLRIMTSVLPISLTLACGQELCRSPISDSNSFSVFLRSCDAIVICVFVPSHNIFELRIVALMSRFSLSFGLVAADGVVCPRTTSVCSVPFVIDHVAQCEHLSAPVMAVEPLRENNEIRLSACLFCITHLDLSHLGNDLVFQVDQRRALGIPTSGQYDMFSLSQFDGCTIHRSRQTSGMNSMFQDE